MIREESEQLKQQEEDDTDPELESPSVAELEGPSVAELECPSVVELECPSIAELEYPSVAELECPSVVGFSVRVWCARIFERRVCSSVVSTDFQLARVLILSQTERAFPYPRVFFLQR